MSLTADLSTEESWANIVSSVASSAEARRDSHSHAAEVANVGLAHSTERPNDVSIMVQSLSLKLCDLILKFLSLGVLHVISRSFEGISSCVLLSLQSDGV